MRRYPELTVGGCLSACWDNPPGAAPRRRHPPEQADPVPTQCMLGDTVNKMLAVYIVFDGQINYCLTKLFSRNPF